MKKILIGIFTILIMNTLYGEGGFLFWNRDNSQEQSLNLERENLKLEMEQRWEKIKELDKKIAFDRNKTNLERNYKEYKKEFDIYMEYLKQDSEKLFEVGDYYFKDGRYEKAYEIFSQDSSNIKNVFGAGTTARFLHKNEEALSFYNKGIEMAPDFYELYLGRGILNRDMGNYQGAIEDFQKYMQYKTDEAVYVGLGDTYIASERYAEAKNILEVARNRYPNSKIIQDMLTRVYARLN